MYFCSAETILPGRRRHQDLMPGIGLLSALLLLFLSLPQVGQQPDVHGDSLVRQDRFDQVISRLNFRNADLRDVLRGLAAKYKLNLIVDTQLERKLTINLIDVTLRDALNYLVDEHQLLMQQNGSIYRISALPAPPEPEKVWQIEYAGGLLSATFENDDIQQAMTEVARRSEVTILIDRRVSGEISGRIHQLPLERGLDQLLRANGYLLRKTDTIYRVERQFSSTDKTNQSGSSLWVKVQKNKIDIELRGAVLSEVIDELARQTGTNFFMLGQPAKPINARASGLTLEECLYFILAENDYTYKLAGEIYLIGDKNNKTLISSQLIRLKNLKVDTVIDMLPAKAMEKAELKEIREHNALLVNGARDVINEIENIVRALDHPIPQIFLEVLVIDYQFGDRKERGIRMGRNADAANDSTLATGIEEWVPGINFFRSGKDIKDWFGKNFGLLGGINIGQLPDDFYLQVEALDRLNRLNVRSKPQLTTLNGHSAELVIGETRYFKLISTTPFFDRPEEGFVPRTTNERFEQIEINTTLKITPWVSASGEITIEITPEFRSANEAENEPGVPPSIRTRSLNSTVRVRDGETIVLGGLIEDREVYSSQQVPILGRIPLLGRLFRHSSKAEFKNELLIYVTPRLSNYDPWMPMGANPGQYKP